MKEGRNAGNGREKERESRPGGRNSSCNSRSRIASGPVVGPSGRVTLGEIIIRHLVLARRPSVEFGRVARVPSLPPPSVSRRRGPACVLFWRESLRRRLIEKIRYLGKLIQNKFLLLASEQSNFDAKKFLPFIYDRLTVQFQPLNLRYPQRENMAKLIFSLPYRIKNKSRLEEDL